ATAPRPGRRAGSDGAPASRARAHRGATATGTAAPRPRDRSPGGRATRSSWRHAALLAEAVPVPRLLAAMPSARNDHADCARHRCDFPGSGAVHRVESTHGVAVSPSNTTAVNGDEPSFGGGTGCTFA